jgi:serine/threonine protein kinase
MPVPTTSDDLVALIRKSALLDPAHLDAYLEGHPDRPATAADLAAVLQADGLLTPFHVEQLLRGKHRGYFLGKYRLIDRIGLGGMGQVFLAEHTSMRRRAALKVLPPERTDSPYSKERFLREARAAGQLDHPNLVRAFDVDQENGVFFLVMEYVDGVTFQDLVHRFGPLGVERAAHYLWQSAHGLAYLHGVGLVHRDIKPANLLVDRQGVVKILDLGLVRGQDQDDDLTRKEGVKILGTADYLAPEQAIDCSAVDHRADVYGLGATAYYLLTGQPPFPADKMAQKLIAHQVKKVKPVCEVRPDVPEELSDVIDRMLAKKPAARFQTAAELVEALAPFALDPPPPPTQQEIPVLAGGAYGHPGAVTLGGPRSSAGSGSAIKYYSADSHPSIKQSLLTPLPRPKSRPAAAPPATPMRTDTPFPALPAAATHGRPRYDSLVDVYEETAEPEPTPEPEPAVVDLKSASQTGRWALVGLAAAATLAVGAWNVVTLSRASARPAAAPAAPPAPAPADAVASTAGS